MGSQGDAGQFRTPRHIIDMMVEIIEPNKRDTVLDPACGTAGFLISSYKHVLKDNLDNEGNSTLSADDRKRLTNNFNGYDISPDMVRLSRVNMYLHKFAQPKIFEYDTLTSLDKWDEQFDIIMANPPFMTPKGGIIPHNRFRVQAKRSEVLFVDYIAEHLNPNGKAAVIVPEGIVFQSANAYKELRKFLVEDGLLYAVISLPAGIFNPYSGVKTSILLFDKTIAKNTDNILFVKIENDGFDLGAQRRAIKDSNIPKVVELLKKYKAELSNPHQPEETEGFQLLATEQQYATVATKKKVQEQDYNLVGERYKEAVVHNTVYPMVELGEVAEIMSGLWKSEREPLTKVKILRNTNFTKDGRLNFSDVAEHNVETNQLVKRTLQLNDIILEKSGGSINQPVGRVALFEREELFSYSNFTSRIRVVSDILKPKFLWLILYYLYSIGKTEKMQSQTSGIRNLNLNLYKQMKIPLPPLSVQEQIVTEIEGYQKIIDGARQVVDNYKPTIEIDPDCEMVELGEVCEVNPKKPKNLLLRNDELVSFVPMADLSQKAMYFSPKEERELKEVINKYTYFIENDVMLAKVTPCFENGKLGIAKGLKNQIGFGSSEYYIIRPNQKILDIWIYMCLFSDRFSKLGKDSMTGTGGLQRIPKDFIKSFKIPLPPIETQKQIVQQIEEEQKSVDECKKLIAVFEQKIKDKISEVWGSKETVGVHP